PLVPTGSTIEEAVDFYTTQMGFAVVWQGSNMAGIKRGDVEFNLIENSCREWLDKSSYGIAVDNLEALPDEYCKTATSARVGAIEMKSWGRREFHMVVPSGVCFQFYQRIRS